MTVSCLGFSKLTLACLAALLALAVTLTLSVPARAEAPALVSYGNVSVEGPGVAVNQSTGDVFMAGMITYCEGAKLCSFQGKLNELNSEGSLITSLGPKSFYAGAAVNPTNENLYVLNARGHIEVYEPSTKTKLGEFAIEQSRNFFGAYSVVQIGVDSAGNVYVPVIPENEILEYSEAGTLLNAFKGSGSGELKEPTAVAVDSAGNLWVADAGNNRIEELSAGDAPLSEIKSEGVNSLALGAGGTVFAVDYNSVDFCGSLPYSPPCTHLVEYSSAGTQVADVGAGGIGRAVNFVAGPINSMVAVNESTGEVYLTDVNYDLLWMFGPPKAPRVVHELTVNVNATEAGLGALVSAGGLASTYQFEYGTTAAYGALAPSVEGNAAGVNARAVWAAIGGLAPSTTYHYRVVVRNALGIVRGKDATFTTAAGNAECSNEAFRTGFSMHLPDCRAYEMVTQPNTAASQPDPGKSGPGADWGTAFSGGGYTRNHAARNGGRFAYLTDEVMPGAESSGMEYLATRGAKGWASEDVIPLQSYTQMFCTNPTFGNAIEAWSSDLTQSVMRVGANQRAGTSTKGEGAGACGVEGLEVVAGEPAGVENLLLRDGDAGPLRVIDTPLPEAIPTDAHFEGASADLSRVFFKENTRLTEDAPSGVEGLYEWDEGTLRLVSVLPDGTPVAGSLAAPWSTHPSVVSPDGLHVFFTAEGNLYERIDGQRTVRLDEAQGGSGPGGGGEFQAASTDGTQVYFTADASAGLTTDTVEGSGANLYRYAAGRLSDLSPAEHAEVTAVFGMSEDGTRVYFGTANQYNCFPVKEEREPTELCFLSVHMWHEGTTNLVATLPSYSPVSGRPLKSRQQVEEGATAVSPNGRYFAFVSQERPTGYDNVDLSSGEADPEIYLYDASAKKLTCVSCAPSGEQPSVGGATLRILRESLSQGVPHYLFDNGRMFFQTEEALLPADTNGKMDVYEYEEGHLHLISSGAGTSRSWLLDVSEEGHDAFLLTRQSLLPGDAGSNESLVIYDAREGGGFAEAASPPTCATAESCRAAVSPQPGIYGAPASQTFAGEGNVSHRKAGKHGAAARKRALRRALGRCRHRFRHHTRKRKACIRGARARYSRGRHRKGHHYGRHPHSKNSHNRRGK